MGQLTPIQTVNSRYMYDKCFALRTRQCSVDLKTLRWRVISVEKRKLSGRSESITLNL